MSRKLLGMTLLLFGMLSLPQGDLRADTIGDLRWQGNDLLARFSDSVSYTIDLAASDSSQLVVRFRDVTIPAGFPTSVSGRGKGGRAPQAIVTVAPPNEVRLTLHAEGRLGYVTLWRPYSRTFVVHTFDWNDLDYATEQYYKGLLAMEQGLNDHAIELLSIAEATGDQRAASVLGSYYARRGDFRTAGQYLDNPRTADDYAALADVKRRTGDSVAAAANQTKADQMMAGASEPDRGRRKPGEPRRGGGNTGGSSIDDDSFETNEMIRDREALKWIYVGGGVLLLLLLIALATWFGRRSRQNVESYPDTIPVPPTPPPPPPPAEAEWVEVRESRDHHRAEPVAADVVETRNVRTEPDAATGEPRETVGASRTVEHTESATSAPAPQPQPHSAPSQAADLRRKIEEMRARTEPRSATPQQPAGRSESNESTIAEARRLQLSRDSVELRRRLGRMRDKR